MLVIKLNKATTDTSIAVLKDDALLDNDSGGVRFLFDLAPAVWTSGANPANGNAIQDLAEQSNGSFVLRSGQSVTYAGGGFDFGAITDDESYISIPASVAASIWGNGSDNQYFLACLYVKLPISSNWNINAVLAPFLQFNNNVNGYQSGPDLITIAQKSGGVLSFRRQTDGTTGNIERTIVVPAGDYGQFAQIACWRTATEYRGRLRTAANTTLSTSAATGANNTGNFSTQAGQAGIGKGLWTPATTADHRSAAKFRLHRGFIENLNLSGRDPQTVLDADWTRVVARQAFS